MPLGLSRPGHTAPMQGHKQTKPTMRAVYGSGHISWASGGQQTHDRVPQTKSPRPSPTHSQLPLPPPPSFGAKTRQQERRENAASRPARTDARTQKSKPPPALSAVYGSGHIAWASGGSRRMTVFGKPAALTMVSARIVISWTEMGVEFDGKWRAVRIVQAFCYL